ncbi:Ig-like domain repeat protein [Paenibacillus sp. y28]|uniref:Ig-like domain repeat protein n=1 Tax=Paenibacillus sp. y28 TaxID=3129110 RepID=UPI003018988F
MRDNLEDSPAKWFRRSLFMAAVLIGLLVLPPGGFAHEADAVVVTLGLSTNEASYGEPVSLHANVTSLATGTSGPGGTILILNQNTGMIRTVPLEAEEPMLSERTDIPTNIPASLEHSCKTGPDGLENAASCPVMKWGDYTFWAFSYLDHREAFGIVQYDVNGNIVKYWENPGASHVYDMTLDADNETVTFWGQGQNKVTMKWSELIAANSSADTIISDLAPGNYSLMALYVPNDNRHFESISASVPLRIHPIASGVRVSSSKESASLGQPVTFTAQFTPAAGIVPTGGVIFYNGAAPIGVAPLQVNGANTVASAVYTTSSLPIGTHPITVSYSGDFAYSPSVSDVLQQKVGRVGTITALQLTGPVSPGTVTAEVYVKPELPGLPVPGGQVMISENAQPVQAAELDAAGKAVITLDSLFPGEHVFIASYLGNDIYESSYSEPQLITIENHQAAALDSLTVAGAELTREFDPAVLQYTAVAGREVEQLLLTGSASSSAAAWTVNGQSPTGRPASIPVPVQEGMNTIRIVVTSADGQAQTVYSITLYKRPAHRLSAQHGLEQIAARFDLSGDGQFNTEDMKAILAEIEPLFIELP